MVSEWRLLLKMTKKIIFIADAFAHQHTGGAELHDAVVIDFFKNQGILQDTKNTSEITTDYIKKKH